MMKKYRLKEDYKKLVVVEFRDKVLTIEEWNELNISIIYALEEVPQRVELKYFVSSGCKDKYKLVKKVFDSFTDQEKELCEKALNGELLDIDSLDDNDFYKRYLSDDITLSNNSVKTVLKQYLKEK